MYIKLTNGKKTITRSKEQYEANINHFTKRGFAPLNNVKKEIKKTTLKDVVDKVVQLKPKKKQGKRNERIKKILENGKR